MNEVYFDKNVDFLKRRFFKSGEDIKKDIQGFLYRLFGKRYSGFEIELMVSVGNYTDYSLMLSDDETGILFCSNDFEKLEKKRIRMEKIVSIFGENLKS
jgi:hypothetical protein